MGHLKCLRKFEQFRCFFRFVICIVLGSQINYCVVDIKNCEITAQVEGEHMTEELKFPVKMLDFQALNGDLVILELALESTILGVAMYK